MKQLATLILMVVTLAACASPQNAIIADDGSAWTDSDDDEWQAANDSADCGSAEMDAAMAQFTNAASDALGRIDLDRQIAQMHQAQAQMLALNLHDCVLWKHAVIDQYPTDGKVNGGWMAVDVAMWERIRMKEQP